MTIDESILEFVAQAFKKTIDATGDFDCAFDAAVMEYCAENECRADDEAHIDVGLLLAEAQARSLRREASGEASLMRVLVSATE